MKDDPWLTAHNFLQKNELSPMFLDQVANFIIENTKGHTLGAAPPSAADPFTGSGRYIPGAADNRAGFGADPFTGTGRYIPGSGTPTAWQTPSLVSEGAYSSTASRQTSTNIYFPKTDGVTFEQANATQKMAKLKELNSGAPGEYRMSEEVLGSLEKLPVSVCDPHASEQPTTEQISLLWKTSHWPEGMGMERWKEKERAALQ
ncbi:hypothetical protein J4Q44_G00378990 [Coregonus suidteri]|uniref:PFU domain-containing protein n=1 Tax=Coregonus suidteri TaxID=861788 RepID=A0AAN8Q578_9TELE